MGNLKKNVPRCSLLEKCEKRSRGQRGRVSGLGTALDLVCHQVNYRKIDWFKKEGRGEPEILIADRTDLGGQKG